MRLTYVLYEKCVLKTNKKKMRNRYEENRIKEELILVKHQLYYDIVIINLYVLPKCSGQK